MILDLIIDDTNKNGYCEENWFMLHNMCFKGPNGMEAMKKWAHENNLCVTIENYFDERGKEQQKIIFHPLGKTRLE